MRISAKAEYACAAMLELAASYGEPQPVRIKAIADAQGISARFLVQILLQLKTAGLVASLAFAITLLRRGKRLAGLALALADAAASFVPIAKLWNIDGRQGDADEVFPLLADHLAAADILAEVAFHLAADKFLKPLVVAFDLLAHV